MKNLIKLFTLLLISAFNLNAQDTLLASSDLPQTETCTLTIEMTDLGSDKGEALIAIYDTKENWLGRSYQGKKSSIENGKAIVVFTDIPYGTYAASAFHDKDMDGKLKTGLFGIPTEPYASSRGAKGRFGPPKWNDAKFVLNSATTKETIKF